MLQREVARNEYGDIFGILEQTIPETLEGLMSDLDELLAEPAPQPVTKKSNPDDSNPFIALFSWFTSPTPEDKSTFAEPLRQDVDAEKALRSFTLLRARRWCRDMYMAEKKRLRMATSNLDAD